MVIHFLNTWTSRGDLYDLPWNFSPCLWSQVINLFHLPSWAGGQDRFDYQCPLNFLKSSTVHFLGNVSPLFSTAFLSCTTHLMLPPSTKSHGQPSRCVQWSLSHLSSLSVGFSSSLVHDCSPQTILHTQLQSYSINIVLFCFLSLKIYMAYDRLEGPKNNKNWTSLMDLESPH